MDFENINLYEQEIEEMSDNTEYQNLEDLNRSLDIRYDIPGVESAVVIGNPEETGRYLDSVQGDEVEGAMGTCGLTSIANLCVLNGQEVTEGMIVEYALENNLCHYDPWSPDDTGGTSAEQQVEILKHFGIDAHFEEAGIHDYEAIADAIESGKGVIAELDAGVLWDEPDCSRTIFGFQTANHAVTITGVARDADSGEIAGFYICDSGRQLESDSCRYVDIEKFSEAYGESVLNSGAVITDNPIKN